MKNILLILTVLFLGSFSFAQKPKKNDWIRVQSDDGEFSIEVPKDYGYFYDEKGFGLIDWLGTFQLSQMSVFNSYRNDTLLSFERYKINEIKKNKYAEDLFPNLSTELVLKILQDERPLFSDNPKQETSLITLEKDDHKINRLTWKSEDQTTINEYFFSNDFIYILTASSRKGHTFEMKKFFDSLKFSPNLKEKSLNSSKLFSKLKQTNIEIKDNSETKTLNAENKANPTKKNVNPFQLIISPRIPYTIESRNKLGVMQLEITFSKSGQVTKINVLKSISKDLTQNAILTALRIKFLPQEENGKPVTVTKIIEYNFKNY
jgi:TonB family protein